MTYDSPAVDVSAQFSDFVAAIQLDGQPIERINTAIRGITTVAVAALDIEEDDVIVQGSFANGTAVEPVNGGYDVDLVLPCVDVGTGATVALDTVEQAFKDNGNYSDKVDEKKRSRCVRLNYVSDEIGEFHVDVVPARPAPVNSEAPLEVPHRDTGWNETAPVEYTSWCRDQGQSFANTVMIVKRWRDENQGVRSAIKSITLQVLIEKHLADVDDEAARLAATLTNISRDLSWRVSPPELLNPVLSSEDLAKRWTDTAFRDFKDKVSEAVNQAEVALRAQDLVSACEAWQQLLGSDFPEAPAAEDGIELADTSHARSYNNEGWVLAADIDRFEIEAHLVRIGKRTWRPRPYKGQVLAAREDKMLRFQTRYSLPNGSIIKWQVVNTGDHAHSVDGGRGEFEDSRTPDPGEKLRYSPSATAITWEGIAYTGVHRIRAVVIRENEVVAESNWIDVTIRAH